MYILPNWRANISMLLFVGKNYLRTDEGVAVNTTKSFKMLKKEKAVF